MILIYRPDNQPEQRFEFRPGRVKVAEMEAIQKRTGMPYGTEFKAKLLQGDVVARRALLWTLQRREHHMLRFEDVDFYDDELVLERDKDELAEEIAAVEEFDGISEEDRATALAVLRQQLETAPEPPGKAPVMSSDGPTG
jgi:hypothetical protein